MNALAIDIGGTNTKVALVSGSGDTGEITTFATSAGKAPELIASIRDAAQRCCGGALIRGAGVAVAGFLNPARDRLIYNPNLPWLCEFPLKDSLSGALGVGVTLEVDSNAACLGEFCFGVARGSRRFMCLVAGKSPPPRKPSDSTWATITRWPTTPSSKPTGRSWPASPTA
jgi:glucokinase